jgi:hypothetical protein
MSKVQPSVIVIIGLCEHLLKGKNEWRRGHGNYKHTTSNFGIEG